MFVVLKRWFFFLKTLFVSQKFGKVRFSCLINGFSRKMYTDGIIFEEFSDEKNRKHF